MNTAVLVVLAALSSSGVTTLITLVARRGTTKAEEKDVLMSGAQKSMDMMKTALDYQAARIEELQARVYVLEHTVSTYHGKFGPLHADH